MNSTTQEPTMSRVTKVTNIYYPYEYTNPCNNLITTIGKISWKYELMTKP